MEEPARSTPGAGGKAEGQGPALHRAGHLALYPLAWCALLLVGLGLGHLFEVADELEPDDLDHRVWSWVVAHREQHPAATQAFRVVTRLGDSPVAIPLVVVGTLGLAALGRRGGAGLGRHEWLFFLGAMLGSWLLGVCFKAHFERERPMTLHRLVAEDSYSFPSGHALNSSTFCALSALTFRRVARTWAMRPAFRFLVYALCSALPPLIGASRVWLAVHYVSDVMGGLILGLTWVLAAVAIHEQWLVRSSREPRAG